MGTETVGDRLKDLRTAAGLTLEQAGEIAGTTKQSASQIEKGITKVPGGLFLYHWARFYGVGLEWLITGKGDPKPTSHAQRPDPQIIAAAIQLSRRAFLELDDETFDPERDSDVVVQAYAFLLARGQTKTNRSNVLDFAKALKRGLQGEIERSRRTGQAGSTGGEASPARGKAGARAAGRRAG